MHILPALFLRKQRKLYSYIPKEYQFPRETRGNLSFHAYNNNIMQRRRRFESSVQNESPPRRRFTSWIDGSPPRLSFAKNEKAREGCWRRRVQLSIYRARSGAIDYGDLIKVAGTTMTKKLDVTRGGGGTAEHTMSDHERVERAKNEQFETSLPFGGRCGTRWLTGTRCLFPSGPFDRPMTADFEKLHPSDRPVIRTTCCQPHG